MATKTITRSSATFSRVPASGWFTLGKASSGTNQNAQITFPALGIAGVINSVKLYIPWNCTAAGEGFSATGAMVAAVGGVAYNFTMAGMSGTAVVTLSSGGWSNSAPFVVDLRGQSGGASSTSKGCDQNVTLSVDYISEPAPTPPPVYTPGTVTGNSTPLDWGDGSDSRGIFAPAQLMYEVQVSLDGGGSWGPLYDTQPGVSALTFNFAAYVGYGQGNDYYNGAVLFRVRTRTPEFNGTVYRSDWATCAAFAIDYRFSSGAPGVATPGTVSGDSVTFDWADVGSQNGVYGGSSMAYELIISLDGGASWGGILTTGPGSSQLAVNIRAYIGVPAGRHYLNPNCRIAVRSVSPNGHRSGWGYSANFAVDYRVAPSQPAAPTVSKDNPYEGETITVTLQRPAAYNTQDANGATNQLTYIVWSDTTEVVRGTAPCTQNSITLTLGIGPWTAGRDDLATGLKVLVRDSMGLDSTWSARTALTVRRYRAPVVVVTTMPRTGTAATIHLTVSDTGYGGTQSKEQVHAIHYKLGSGSWTAAALGTWDGLANAFTLSGLAPGSRYGLQVKAFSAEAIAGLGDKEGAAYTTTVLEFSPALFAWYDTATGGSGTATKALVVGEDYGAAVEPGWGVFQNGIEVSGAAKLPYSTLFTRQDQANEGGQFSLQKSANANLAADVVFDCWNNRIRIFENGGSYRGASFDITGCGPVDANSFWHSSNLPIATGALAYGAGYTNPYEGVIDHIRWSRIGNMIFLEGSFYRGNSSNAVLTVLPAEIRPQRQVIMGIRPIENVDEDCIVAVKPDGNVECSFRNLASGAYPSHAFSLTSICYNTANAT